MMLRETSHRCRTKSWIFPFIGGSSQVHTAKQELTTTPDSFLWLEMIDLNRLLVNMLIVFTSGKIPESPSKMMGFGRTGVFCLDGIVNKPAVYGFMGHGWLEVGRYSCKHFLSN